MKGILTLALADDDYIYRQMFSSYIKGFEDIDLIIEAENGKELINTLQQNQKPDMVLLDIEMPVMNGKETLEHLCAVYPDIKVLILTAHNDNELFHYFIEKGATCFIPKEIGFALIVEAIYAVQKNGHYFAHVDLKNIIAAKKNNTPDVACITSFTKREMEIIRLITQGYTNKNISIKLNISQRTVDGHRSHILQKANVHNTAGLIRFALKNNLAGNELPL